MGTMETKLTFMVQNMKLILLQATFKHFMITMFHVLFVWFVKEQLLRCFRVSMAEIENKIKLIKVARHTILLFHRSIKNYFWVMNSRKRANIYFQIFYTFFNIFFNRYMISFGCEQNILRVKNYVLIYLINKNICKCISKTTKWSLIKKNRYEPKSRIKDTLKPMDKN